MLVALVACAPDLAEGKGRVTWGSAGWAVQQAIAADPALGWDGAELVGAWCETCPEGLVDGGGWAVLFRKGGDGVEAAVDADGGVIFDVGITLEGALEPVTGWHVDTDEAASGVDAPEDTYVDLWASSGRRYTGGEEVPDGTPVVTFGVCEGRVSVDARRGGEVLGEDCDLVTR
ncbi:MAG: hypothetical protein ACOZNI_25905 [Myxococcota bacterium]